MVLESIIDQSCFATIATISKDSLEKLEVLSEANYYLIKQFDNIILSTNAAENVQQADIDVYHSRWKELYPKSIITHTDLNKGHMFGTIDLEEEILKVIREYDLKIKYLWKSMDDVLTTTDILKLDLPEADFYYLPGFSYESILIAGGKDNLHKNFESDYWTPQTTFFILNINNIDSLYGDDVDSKMHLYQKEKARNEHIKPWDMPFDIKFACEDHLGRTTKHLTKHCLIQDLFEDLLGLVEFNRVGDPSHKNIYFQNIGICHYHFYKNSVYYI